MSRAKIFSALLALALLGGGCGSEDPEPLTVAQAEDTLRELPYEVEFNEVQAPRGATGALAGTVVGPRGIELDFAVTFGSATPIPVPRSGTSNTFECEGYTLSMNDDTPLRGEGRRDHRSRLEMGVELERRLCEATGAEWSGI